MENIKTVVEILKENDIQRGFKLYSSIMGECILKEYTDHHISVKSEYGSEYVFDAYGRLSSKGECLLFPSKKERDWNKIDKTLPYKDGEFIVVKTITKSTYIAIYKTSKNNYLDRYTSYDLEGYLRINSPGSVCPKMSIAEIRKATDKEKYILLGALADQNLYWDSNAKEIKAIGK